MEENSMSGTVERITSGECIQKILEMFMPVSVLSEKNGCRVLRLRHRQTNRDLVLRSFPKAVEAYEILCGIHCENLPMIYDVIATDDGQIVLEEYIDGLTVAQVLETGTYRPRGAKKVMAGVCNGLTVLHDRGIIHRDVKPENVVIDTQGRVVLIDLNASRIIGPSSKDTVIMGTVGYASPEQLGLSQSDARTDLYAAGVLLNVMLTGKHPTQGYAKGHAGAVVRKCTALNPEDRYQSARKLYHAL